MVADFLEKTLKTISKTQRTDSRVDTLLPNAKLFPRVSYVQCHDRLGGILVSAVDTGRAFYGSEVAKRH